IAAHRVDKVADADAVTIAVATGDDDFEVVIGQLDAGGHRERASVKRVNSVGMHVAGQIGGAADTGDDHQILGGDVGVAGGHLHGLEDAEVAAARAPVGINRACVSFDGQFDDGGHVSSSVRSFFRT